MNHDIPYSVEVVEEASVVVRIEVVSIPINVISFSDCKISGLGLDGGTVGVIMRC